MLEYTTYTIKSSEANASDLKEHTTLYIKVWYPYTINISHFHISQLSHNAYICIRIGLNVYISIYLNVYI